MAWPRIRHRPRDIDDAYGHLSSAEKRRVVQKQLDSAPFPWLVILVAGAGVFAYSYNTSVLHLALPLLRRLYWPNNATNAFLLEVLSLPASIFGQLCYGYFADRYGRVRMLGPAWIFVLFSIVGFAQSSPGNDNSMSLLGWLSFWRVMLCIGLGAQLPLNSVIVAEWAPTRLRPTALTVLFLMKPVGELLAGIVALVAASAFDDNDVDSHARTLDKVWRTIVGVGAVPALIALILRVTIPESPRYLLDVSSDVDAAFKYSQTYDQGRDAALSVSIGHMLGSERSLDDMVEVSSFSHSRSEGLDRVPVSIQRPFDEISDVSAPHQHRFNSFTRRSLWKFFIAERNWQYLAGVAACWFVLGLGLAGLDGSNPLTLDLLFATTSNTPELEYLKRLSRNFLLIVCIGSIVGVGCAIPMMRLDRHTMLRTGLVALVGLLAATGAVLYTSSTSEFIPVVVLYPLSYLFLSHSSAIVSVFSAEIFPTRYRATCYALAMSSGTTALLLVRILLYYGGGSDRPRAIYWRSSVLWVCIPLLLLAAILAWGWLPQVQVRKDDVRSMDAMNSVLMNKTLEVLGEGVTQAELDGQVIGLGNRTRHRFRRRS